MLPLNRTCAPPVEAPPAPPVLEAVPEPAAETPVPEREPPAEAGLGQRIQPEAVRRAPGLRQFQQAGAAALLQLEFDLHDGVRAPPSVDLADVEGDLDAGAAGLHGAGDARHVGFEGRQQGAVGVRQGPERAMV